MKIEFHGENLVARSGLGRPRKIPLLDIEAVELIENSSKTRVILGLSGGQRLGLAKLPREEAHLLRDRIQESADPPEAKADERLALGEIRRRLGVMSERPGLRTSRLGHFLFDQALRHRASDLHLEGSPRAVQLSFRIDGVLHDLGPIRPDLGERLFTYLKVESGVASYRSDIPQEGALRLALAAGPSRDFRLSFMPTREAEKAVVRIFGLDLESLRLSDLGFSPAVRDGLGRLLQRREGMILLTGPSASGKTTTLYAGLRRLLEGDRRTGHLVSIEDPVECIVPGLTQVQVDPRRDMTFDRLLGNLLRQDAEVIMVGEVRGKETAAIAIQASLTGHLILSTIHAGQAPEVLVRLLDLGLEPYQVASALAGAMSQRLVRTICDHCRSEDVPSDDLIAEYESLLPKGAVFQRGAGCDQCYGTGYRGRTAIAELIAVNSSWQELIRSRPTSNEAREFALAHGMVPLVQDAAAKAAQGITTLAEVKRALG